MKALFFFGVGVKGWNDAISHEAARDPATNNPSVL